MTGWIEKELGEVLTLNYGWSLPSKVRTEGEYPVYGSNGIVGSHDTPLVSTEGLIVGRKGSAGNVHYSRKPFCPIDTTFFITQEDTNLDIEFLYFLLLHINLKRVLGDVGVPGLNREVAYKEKAKFPSDKSEQRRIAHILTTVQTAIEQQAKLIDLTRELKSALMKKLFTEGLRGEKQKETEIGLVPAGWDVSNIGEVARFQSGGTPSREKPEYWSGGTIPWVKTGEINYKVIETTEEFITDEGLNNSAARLLPKGTLLCAMYGQGITRGRVGILGLDATTNQACAAITPFDEDQVSTWFLYYYMQYHYQNLRELGHGANQRNLNMDLIKSFPLSYPASDEQKEIVKSLSVIDKKISQIEQKRTLLEELFRTLLHQLMTGQVRVKDLDI